MGPLLPSISDSRSTFGFPPSLPALKQVVGCSGGQIVTQGPVHLFRLQIVSTDNKIKRRVEEELVKNFSCTQRRVDETTIPYFWNKLAGMQDEGSVYDSLTCIDSKILFDHFDTCFGIENNILKNSFIHNFSKQSSIDVILNFHFQKMQLLIKMIDSEISWAEEEWSKQFIKRLGSINYFDIKSSERQFQADLKTYEDVMFNLLCAREFLNSVLNRKTIPLGNYRDVCGAMANGIDMTYNRNLSSSNLR